MDAQEVLAWLERRGTRRTAEGMARYRIHTDDRVVGVPVGTMRAFAARLGKDHALAARLWSSGWYEARIMAALVDDPPCVTRRQMNAWAADFDNWATCDTACFHLFDRTPFAWEKARQWSTSPREFVKRAAFALIASLALHDKAAPDTRFRAMLPLVERGARDERNFVKKAVSWALRSIGRRSLALNTAALAVAEKLSGSAAASCRWVGKDARRELSSPKVRGRLVARRGGRKKR